MRIFPRLMFGLGILLILTCVPSYSSDVGSEGKERSQADPLNSGLFEPYETHAVGSAPKAVVIGDVNNDGRNDVVLVTTYANSEEFDYRVNVFIQDEAGELLYPVRYLVTHTYRSYHPLSVDIGDLNNDGRNDVVVAGDNCIGVFYQNTSNTLNSMIPYPSSHFNVPNVCKVRVGDFNADGLTDVVSVDYNADTFEYVDVYYQNVSGSLDPVVTYPITGGATGDLDVGDANNDGLDDIIVKNGSGVGILTQNPEGGFDASVHYPEPGRWSANGIGLGDVNNDGRNDVVLNYEDHMNVLLQNNSGTMDRPLDFPNSGAQGPVAIADVNGDGRLDVVTAGTIRLDVFIQSTSGALLPYEEYTLPHSYYDPHALDVADINSDGVNDVALAGGGGLTVLYGTGTNKHTLNTTVFPSLAGTVAGGAAYNHGVTATVGATPSPGWAFDHWEGDNIGGSTVNPQHITMNGGKSVTAVFRFVGLSQSDPFLPYVSYNVGSCVTAADIGDVNNDGRNDLVAIATYDNSPANDRHVYVLLQNVGGRLNHPMKYPLYPAVISSEPKSLDIGDLNNDGRNDVVVPADGGIGVLLQNGSGDLDPIASYASGHNNSYTTFKVRVGDFNNDELLDVVSLSYSSRDPGGVDVYLQNPGGTLDSPEMHVVQFGGSGDMDVGDANNDGLDDIIVISNQGTDDTVGILLQNEDGTLNAPAYYDLPDDGRANGVGVGDVSSDSRDDVVLSGSSIPHNVSVFLQTTTGTMAPAVNYSVGGETRPVVVYDVDGDRRNDVITLGGASVAIHLQAADGTLLPDIGFEVPRETFHELDGLAVGDVNGDHVADVVTTSCGLDASVLYGTDAPPTNTLLSSNIWPAGAGAVSGNGPYAPGSSATVRASSNIGYVFHHWEGDGITGSTTNPEHVTMNSDKLVTAVFVYASMDPPQISMDATSLSNSCELGANAPSRSLDIWNGGGQKLNYSISDDVDWLSCSPTSGGSTGEHDTIVFDYSTSSLSAGSYTATITISDPAATNDPQQIVAYLDVISYPVIALGTHSISASCLWSENAADQTFHVWNSGGGTLSYSITDDATWLQCVPSSGTSSGEWDTITIDFSTSALAVGSYTATITISDSNATNDPQQINVALTVLPNPLTGINLASPAAGSVLYGRPTFTWTAEGGSNNVFAVDLSFDYTFSSYWSSWNNLRVLNHGNSWTVPNALWNAVPGGFYIYWRVRGANLDEDPLNIIASDEVWWFYKP